MAYNTLAVVVIVLHTVFISLACAAVALRFIAVKIRGHKPGPSDWMCLVSLLATLAWSGFAYYVINLGIYGVGLNDLSIDQLQHSLWIFFTNTYTWALAISSFRISMLLFYLDIVHIKVFRVLVHMTIAFVVAFFLAVCLYMIFRCKPVSAAWSLTAPPGACQSAIPIEVATAALNIFLDLWIVFLPAPVIVRLKISRTKKAGIMTTFGLGIIIAGIDAARMHDTLTCVDFTMCICTDIYIIGEMCLGIVVTCAPLLGPVFLRSRSRKLKNFSEPAENGGRYRNTIPNIIDTLTASSLANPDQANYTYTFTTSGRSPSTDDENSRSDHIRVVRDIEIIVERKK